MFNATLLPWALVFLLSLALLHSRHIQAGLQVALETSKVDNLVLANNCQACSTRLGDKVKEHRGKEDKASGEIAECRNNVGELKLEVEEFKKIETLSVQLIAEQEKDIESMKKLYRGCNCTHITAYQTVSSNNNKQKGAVLLFLLPIQSNSKHPKRLDLC